MDPTGAAARRSAAGPPWCSSTPRTAGATTPAASPWTTAIERAMTLGICDVGRAQHQPLRHRRLVRDARGRRRPDRRQPDEHARRSSRRPAPGSRCSAPTRSRSPRRPAASARSASTWPRRTIPRGRIEVAARRGEIAPAGWAIDADGTPATTPEAALAGALHPLGGAEETGGYKGYGLALVVDLLTGILAGAAFGPNIVGLFSTEGTSRPRPDLHGHRPGGDRRASRAFEARLEDSSTSSIEAPTASRCARAGAHPRRSPRRQPSAASGTRGIVIDREHHETLLALGERLGVPLPDPMPGPSDPTAAVAGARRGTPSGGHERPLRRRRRRRRHPGARDRAPAARAAGRTCASSILEKEPELATHQTRPQQRRAPRRAVLPAGLAQGQAVPRGQGRPRGVLRRARHPRRALRQARRRPRRGRAASASRHSRSAPIANGVAGPRGGRPRARSARSSRTPPASGRSGVPGHGHHRLPRGSRSRTPTRCARSGGDDPTPRARSPRSRSAATRWSVCGTTASSGPSSARA